jgi:hypothetical protein
VMQPCCAAFGDEPAGRSELPGLGGPGSEWRDVRVEVGFGRRIWFGVGFGWEVVPDLGVFPVVVEGDRERVWGSVAGDGSGQWLDDRRWSTLIGVA